MHFLQHGSNNDNIDGWGGNILIEDGHKKIRKGIFYFVPKAETIPPLILFVSREGEIETKGKNDENKPMPKQQHPKNIYSIKCEGKNLLAFAKIYLLAQREKGMQAKNFFTEQIVPSYGLDLWVSLSVSDGKKYWVGHFLVKLFLLECSKKTFAKS